MSLYLGKSKFFILNIFDELEVQIGKKSTQVTINPLKKDKIAT